MKTTYAKTPWKICYDGQIDSSDGQFVCSFRWESFNEFEKHGQDAAFIVRAVNAHKELVEALARCEKIVALQAEDDIFGNAKSLLNQIQSALAKARGNDA